MFSGYSAVIEELPNMHDSDEESLIDFIEMGGQTDPVVYETPIF